MFQVWVWTVKPPPLPAPPRVKPPSKIGTWYFILSGRGLRLVCKGEPFRSVTKSAVWCRVFFFKGGILVLSPKICPFGGQGFFYAKILLFSTLISFEIYFTFCNRQFYIPFDACFVFSVVFPLFFCQKKNQMDTCEGGYTGCPTRKGKKKNPGSDI